MAREIINSPAPPMLISAAITEMANHAGNEPWPSLEAASRWFDRASIVLALSLLAGFAATVVIVWLGIAKEHHWDLLRDSSNEKVATLELRTAEANAALGVAQADIAKAHARIAEADARTKEAELKLEQLRKDLGPRQLQRDLFIKEITGQPSARVEIMYLQDDPECFGLAQQIWLALESGKWPVEVPKPIPPLIISNFPTAMSVGGQPSGVTVVASGITKEEASASENAMMGREWVKTPWTVLMHALGQALGKVGGSAGGVSPPPEGMLRVVISPRI